MTEMAIVSYNPLKLAWHKNKGIKNAHHIESFLKNPSQLFGTTLIGVNFFLVISSESMRQLFTTLNINPNLAPLVQVPFIIIFGDLGPMFAARVYAENLSLKAAPIIYASSKILTPLLWIIDKIAAGLKALLHKEETAPYDLYVSREELLHFLEEEERRHPHESDIQQSFIQATFLMRERKAAECLVPLKKLFRAANHLTKSDAVHEWKNKPSQQWLPIFFDQPSNIIGYHTISSMTALDDDDPVEKNMLHPWYISANMTVKSLLKSFQEQDDSIAFVLNDKGLCTGIIPYEHLINFFLSSQHTNPEQPVFIDRQLNGQTTLKELEGKYQILLPGEPDLTISQLIQIKLGHLPDNNETIVLMPYEVTAIEVSLLDVKKVRIKTKRT